MTAPGRSGMVDETLDDALSYPLRGDDAVGRLVVGSGLTLLSVLLVVPGILLAGYAVAVCRSVLAGEAEPPVFGDWRALARDGLDVAAITLVYCLPGVVLGALAAGVPVLASMGPGGGAGGILAAVLAAVLGLGASVAGVLYALAAGYALPAALVNYARTGEVSAAWDRPTLRAALLDGDHLATWMAGVLVVVAAGSLGGATAAAVIGFPVLFYGLVAGTTLFTRASMDALGLEPEREAAEEVEHEAADVGGPGGAADDGEAAADPLQAVAGVDPSAAEALRAAGFESPADLRAATRSDLASADGVGPATADRVKRAVEERA